MAANGIARLRPIPNQRRPKPLLQLSPSFFLQVNPDGLSPEHPPARQHVALVPMKLDIGTGGSSTIQPAVRPLRDDHVFDQNFNT